MSTLGLNFTSCSDSSMDMDNSQIEAAFSTDLGYSHSHFDLCPPFCTCNCCHVNIIDFGSSNFEPIISEISSEDFGYFDNPGQDMSHSLLQPPKI